MKYNEIIFPLSKISFLYAILLPTFYFRSLYLTCFLLITKKIKTLIYALKASIVFLKNMKKVYLIVFYLYRQLFTPELIMSEGITVVKTTQASTEFMRLITNPNVFSYIYRP